MIQRPLFVLLFLLVSLPVLALPDYSAGLLEVPTVMAVAAEVTPERFPNADSVLVDDHIIEEYEPDGRSISYDDTFVKVLTEKGRRESSTLSRHFTLPYGEAGFTLVEVIKPDGTRRPVDLASMSRVMVDRSQMGSNIFNPNSKVLQVTVPDLAIGDVVRYVAKSETLKPRVPNTWSDYQVFEYTSPILRLVYEVRAPQSLPLQNIALKAEVEGTVAFTQSEADGRIVYRWEVTDVPQMFGEPKMPPLYTVVQRLLVSTIPDWQYVSRWYWRLSEPHFACTPEMTAKVEELTKGLTGRDERIAALFRFVSQEIRYMGITVEEEAPGYEPHPAKDTFAQRHGVCRDKAALLVALLREAGLKAYPVLIHNGPKKDEEVAQPFFNHAVVAAETEDGNGYILMDPTDENTKQLFPAYLANQSYLVARPEGDTLRTSPVEPAAENLVEVTTRATLATDGSLRGTADLLFDGINDNVYRGYFSRVRPEEQRRLFESVVNRMVAGARLTSLTILPEDMQDTSRQLEVRLAFAAEDAVMTDGETAMVTVPRLGTGVGMVNFILRDATLAERKFPFLNEFACGVRESLELTVAPDLGQAVALPEYPVIDTPTLLWTRRLEATDNGLAGQAEFLIRVPEFTPEEYLALKETLRVIETNARKMPVFVRPAAAEPSADIRILEDVWDYEIADRHNWTTTRRIRKQFLTYKGMKDHSEIKIDYNPAFAEVELVAATVRNGDQVQTISEKEINLMDQAWVAAAPRYPEGKTLVASLPGVQVGSIVEYSYRMVFRERPFVAGRVSFRDHDPVDRRTLRIRAPRSLRLDFSPGDPAVVRADSTEEGFKVYEFTAVDQPAVRREDDLPPWWAFNPTVTLSSGEWREYAKEVRGVLDKAAADAKLAERKADELCAGVNDSEARVVAIRDFVAKAILAAGPGLHELPLAAITPADRVLADGYGNSADRAVLLYAMLRRAGLRPEFVLASRTAYAPSLREQELALPAAYLFPSVLVRVSLGSRSILLNDTDQYAPLGATAHEKRAGLFLDRGRIALLEPPDNLDNRTETAYELELTAEGDAVLRKTTRYFGTAHAGRRKFYDELPPEERRRHFQKLLSELSQNAEPIGELATDFANYPGTESFVARVASYAVRDGQYLYFTLPASFANLFDLRSDKRSNDYYSERDRDLRVTTNVLLPRGFSAPLLMPEILDEDVPGGLGQVSVHSSYSEADGTLQFVHAARLQAGIVPVDLYDELFELNRRLGRSSARTVLLQAHGKAE